MPTPRAKQYMFRSSSKNYGIESWSLPIPETYAFAINVGSNMGGLTTTGDP
jgi:hypothetical protein